MQDRTSAYEKVKRASCKEDNRIFRYNILSMTEAEKTIEKLREMANTPALRSFSLSTDNGETYKELEASPYEAPGETIKLIGILNGQAHFENENISFTAEWEDWMELGKEYNYKIT